jgi:predicted nucleotidyltransferase component of viral defense system
MKAYLRELIAPAQNKLIGVHLVREYLQLRILQSLQRAGAMQTLAFHGGTSLRILYGIPRYSEDLDFSLELHPEAYDFRAYLQRVVRDLSEEAYTIDVKLNDKRIVHKAFVRLRGLFYELGLSGHATETLAIKIEVDTHPPAKAGLVTTPRTKHGITLHLHHHDPATLLAGKLHAVLLRDYLKGRDIYDLWWYLNQPEWPAPNLAHLNQNMQQSGWTGDLLTSTNWKAMLRNQLSSIQWLLVLEDVGPFIIDQDDQGSFNKDHLLALLD